MVVVLCLSAPPPLSLREALLLVREHGLDAALAEARLEQARGAWRSELSALLPRLEVGGTVARNSTAVSIDVVDATKGYTAMPLSDPRLPPGSLSLTPNQVDSIELQPLVAFSTVAQLTVPVLNAAAVGRTAAAARRVTGSELLVRYAAETAEIRVWQLLLAAKTARALLTVGQERLKVAKEQEQAAQARFKAGELDRLGLSRARAVAAAAERMLRQAAANEVGARATVAALLGRDERFEVGEVPEPPAVEGGSDEARVLAQRLDVKAAQEQVEGATLGVSAAKLRIAPTVDFNGQFAYGNVQNFAGASSYWVVQGRLSWSLFDGGDRYGELQRRRGLEAEAKLQQDQTSREARRQYLVAREQVEASKAALLAAQSEVTFARESLEAARAQFRVGALGYLELVDAQNARFNAEEAQANESLRLSTARLELALALGDAGRVLEPLAAP
jgi:outer membrane protein TolC